MIKKILLGIGVLSLTLFITMPVANTISVYASEIESDEGVDTCNTYVWMYKEENGKRYMRLWDKMCLRWVTDWILVD